MPKHHHRQSIRLRGWDYTSPGLYFITICTHQRQHLFADSVLRSLAENAWQNIPTQPHAQHVTLDEWVVMPNHVHGIVALIEKENGESRHLKKSAVFQNDPFVPDVSCLSRRLAPLPFDEPPNSPPGVESGSVGAIVGNFKSLVTRRANNIRRTPGAKFWQRGYYDRIVRSDRELNAIRHYIRDNPHRWQQDRENLDALLTRMRWVTP
jgi:REP element-mobilizing transposase RayT